MTDSTDKTKPRAHRRLTTALALCASLSLVGAACGGSSAKSSVDASSTGGGGSSSTSGGTTVTVGYFPNITHAPALVGLNAGIFAKYLGDNKLGTPESFSAGPAENTALLAGSVDIGFEGPSSALSAYSKSHAITIIAGVASGGAGLVVNKSITSPKQLKGTKLGSPELANTQDIALRYWLKSQGYTTTPTGGGDVDVEPSATSSSAIVTEFKAGQIQGAWMPEPYEQELVAAGGHILVPEASLWPGGQWATTDLVVRTAFLQAHPAAVTDFLKGLLATLSFMQAHKAQAETDANAQLKALQGKTLKTSVLSAAWNNITFTSNPEAASIETQVQHGEAVGLLKSPGSLTGLFDLRPLNSLLAKAGQPAVKGL